MPSLCLLLKLLNFRTTANDENEHTFFVSFNSPFVLTKILHKTCKRRFSFKRAHLQHRHRTCMRSDVATAGSGVQCPPGTSSSKTKATSKKKHWPTEHTNVTHCNKKRGKKIEERRKRDRNHRAKHNGLPYYIGRP